jgi:hypothetical protein
MGWSAATLPDALVRACVFHRPNSAQHGCENVLEPGFQSVFRRTGAEIRAYGKALARIKLIRGEIRIDYAPTKHRLSTHLLWPKDIGCPYSFPKPFPLRYIGTSANWRNPDKKSEWAPKSFPITVFMCFLRLGLYTRTDGWREITSTWECTCLSRQSTQSSAIA